MTGTPDGGHRPERTFRSHPCVGIFSEQKTPQRRTIHDMHDRHFVRRRQLRPSQLRQRSTSCSTPFTH